MQEPARVLLLDDGELSEVASLLDGLGVAYERLQTSHPDNALSPPADLLISTGRHAHSVRRGSPPGARPGRPLRIIASGEDSSALHRRFRRAGFQLRVRVPGHRDIWDLLIHRALYPGAERRTADRIAMGAAISLVQHSHPRGRTTARLIDISNRGCRILSSHRLGLGRPLGIVLPRHITRGMALRLDGKVVRVSKNPQSDGHYAGLHWNPAMSDSIRARLSFLLNQWSLGPPNTSPHPDWSEMPVLPAERCPSIAGLTLDDETDPPVAVPQAVAKPVDGVTLSHTSDRRDQPRGAFPSPVPAHRGGRGKVLMARDLSGLGMRIEPMPCLDLGQQAQLVLHGPGLIEALQVSARVVRDDGPDGMVLAFEALSPHQLQRLNRLVAELPQVESLALDGTLSQGAVLAELVDEGPPLR